MTEELNLTLPPRKGAPQRTSKLVPALLLLLLIVAAANLAVAALGLARRRGGGQAAESGMLGADALKNLALKLEKQGLTHPAVQAWKDYLDRSHADAQERAKIWYRIGKLYQEANDHQQALDAYYRSESFAQPPDLRTEINRRVEQCLEAAGKFAALRYELADRVGVGSSRDLAGEEVVAEIGPDKITKAELDRRIEQRIDRQLDAMAAFLPAEERRRQKEQLVKQFASGAERLRFLNQILLEEILYRKAREDKLAEDPAVQDLLQDAQRSILAQQVLEKELADQIRITPGDLQTYYEAHKQDYVEPEQVKISQILVKDEKTARELIRQLNEGADFEELARRQSLDDATKNQGGRVASWIARGQFLPGVAGAENASKTLFETPAGQVAKTPIRSDKGFHVVKVMEKKPERRKAFEEVRAEVYRAVRARKEEEVRQALLERLKDRYDVVVHAGRLEEEAPSESPAPDKAAKAPQQEKKK